MKKRIVDQIRSKLHKKFWCGFDYLRLVSMSSWNSGSDKHDFVFEVQRNDLWPADKKIEILDEIFLKCQRNIETILKKILKDEPEIRFSTEVMRQSYSPKPYIAKLVVTVYYRKERVKRLLKQQSENDSLWEIVVQ